MVWPSKYKHITLLLGANDGDLLFRIFTGGFYQVPGRGTVNGQWRNLTLLNFIEMCGQMSNFGELYLILQMQNVSMIYFIEPICT